MEKKKYITENTEIILDEEAFKTKAEELICELFVDYVNTLYKSSVVEIKR